MQKRCEKLEAVLHVLGPRDQELPGGSGDMVMQDTCAKLSTELNDCRKRLFDAEKENTKLHGQLRHRRSTMEKVRDQLISIKVRFFSFFIKELWNLPSQLLINLY